MTLKIRAIIYVVAMLSVLASPSPVRADASDTLKEYVADLQRRPDDYALREKIIKLAREMNPPPSIPEEARRHIVMADTLLKDAKKTDDFSESAAEFKAALLIAPWWSDGYLRLGTALKSAEQYDAAIRALKLYVAANPGGDLARAAQDEIYIIEAKQKKAGKEAQAKAAEDAKELAAKKANPQEDFRKSLEGARFMHVIGLDHTYALIYFVENGQVHNGWFDKRPTDPKAASIREVEWNDGRRGLPIDGKRFLAPRASFEKRRDPTVYTISDDGQFISGGDVVLKRIN